MTETVQVESTPSEIAGGGLPQEAVSAKSDAFVPLMIIPVRLKSTPPVLVSWTVSGVLVVFSGQFPNVRGLAGTVTSGVR